MISRSLTTGTKDNTETIPFYVIKRRGKADPCHPSDTSCTFHDEKINITDTSFSYCIDYNDILSEHYKGERPRWDHLKCCEGNFTDDLNCSDEEYTRTNRLFEPKADDSGRSVEMVVNSAVDLRHISERLYTCKCNYSDATRKPDHFVMVRTY